MTPSSRRQPTFVLPLLLLIAVLVGVSWPTINAEARPMLNPCTYDNTCTTTTVRRTFEPVGQLSPGGRSATVYIHIPCATHQHFWVEVRVTQGDVTAEGFRIGPCGRGDVWPVVVRTSGGEQLTEGQARACGSAETHRHRQLTSGQSWCRTIMIVG